ncbi:MAG: M20 family metallopeptidase [Pyrinomonadaceae bacterium]
MSLIEYFENKTERIVELSSALIDIESPSFDVEGSREAAEWIESEILQAWPEAACEKVEADGVGTHLVVRISDAESNGKKPVLILGHSDTVHPRGAAEENPTRIENGRLYGCGSFDMKANIAVMIETLRGIREEQLQLARPVTILICCDEEVGSETGRPLVEREALLSEFALVFEPSAAGKVKTGRKGTGGYELHARGIPAHAGLEPEKGASAILEIARQIEKLHELTDFSIGTTVTVGLVKGGTATNVVPANATCSVDVRFETLAEAKRIENEIRNLTAVDEKVGLTITGEINRPPMERTEGVVRLFEKAKALASELGFVLEETKVGGASDGNFVGALGVPLLDGLGVKGDGAHTLDEYIEIPDIPSRAALLAKLLVSE